MLKRIRSKVLMRMCDYYGKAGMRCFEKIDAYGPENNEYWRKKTREYWDKEANILAKLVGREDA